MNRVKHLLPAVLIMLNACTGTGEQKILVLATTDVHGVILPYDFISGEKLSGSLASCATYVNQLRNKGNPVILLDNGDNLQGQPVVYYYNFIDTISPHINAEAMNFLQYDAATVGNHDIEAGHSVYDRLIKEYDFPLLAANAVDAITGEPWFKPFTIIRKNNLKIAVFGLITPAVPTWLPPELYSGIEFRDMRETTEKWMPLILDENPDIVIGLFHSGWDNYDNEDRNGTRMNEDGSSSVAFNVRGFDVIITGHDHSINNEKIVNKAGDTVLILNGGSRAEKIAQAEIVITKQKPGGKLKKVVKGKIIDVDNYKPDRSFTDNFSGQFKTIKKYVDKVIAVSEKDISSRDAYFGSSAFVDMIHLIQLGITGADISFAAPLSFDVRIAKGPVTVGDVFNLYRFENMLYTVSMTGEEIRKYLEFSYSLWFSTMTKAADPLLKIRRGKENKPVLTNGKAWLRNQTYNFDSAAGIDYIVDVRKPEGSRVTIRSFSNGRHFDLNSTYKVAVNSYRGNGGGGHFFEGAGIGKTDLKSRLISSTDRDLRYYILKDLETKKEIRPVALGNWQLVPVEWMKTAIPRDYKLLFGTTKF